jgi:hypothetical protein
LHQFVFVVIHSAIVRNREKKARFPVRNGSAKKASVSGFFGSETEPTKSLTATAVVRPAPGGSAALPQPWLTAVARRGDGLYSGHAAAGGAPAAMATELFTRTAKCPHRRRLPACGDRRHGTLAHSHEY